MRSVCRVSWLALAACLVTMSCAPAQQSSVGRGAPDPLVVDVIVGSEGKGMFTGAGIPPDNMPIYAAKDGATPAGVEPLPIDIFATRDFYKDRDLWSNKLYFRCNSPFDLEGQWGANNVEIIGPKGPQTAAWGHCDRDMPREALVSPYPFKTAQEHWEALKAETVKRGGPTKHTDATVPGEWTGRYGRGFYYPGYRGYGYYGRRPYVGSYPRGRIGVHPPIGSRGGVGGFHGGAGGRQGGGFHGGGHGR